MNLNLRKGFSLVELLVVIGILGVLSTLALLAMGRAREAAKEAAARDDLANLRTAILLLENDTEKWPNGCPPWSTRNPEVELTTQQAALTQAPIVGDQGDGCQWTSQAVAKWQGPYVTGVENDPWGNPYYFDPDFVAYNGCPSKPTETTTAAVLSFGPNGTGLNQYDCDDVFLKLQN
ncbi:MAG: prepilin-type N-terminal cleavage/methylation domain-containing protein [Patescibacteria group bacterium]